MRPDLPDPDAVSAQSDRLYGVDSRLRGVPLPGRFGEIRIARGTAGTYTAVGWSVSRRDEDDPSRAWNPDVSASAAPLVLPTEDSAAAAAVSQELLTDWVRAVADSDPGAVLMVLWPAADDLARRWVERAGFVAGGALSYRPPGGLPAVRPEIDRVATPRRAGPADLDAVLALHAEEVEFGAATDPMLRQVEAERKATRERVAAGLRGDGPSVMHVVEADGRPIAFCESWPVAVAGYREGAEADWLSGILPAGRYAYLNSVGVTATHRGRGLGALLVREVLCETADSAPDGTYLWYSGYNPVSPGFWQVMGYRPLWTRYQREPIVDAGPP